MNHGLSVPCLLSFRCIIYDYDFCPTCPNKQNCSGTSLLRACPNRIVVVKRKSKSVRFRECFGRCVRTESNREMRNSGEKQRAAATHGPFKTMYTCQVQGSATQIHQSSRHIPRHFDPGGRWASRGGGGASNDDAPGSNFNSSEASF